MLVLKYTNFRSPPPSPTIFFRPPLRVPKNSRSPPINNFNPPPLVILNELSLNIIRSSYEGLTCRVIHREQPTEAFNVRTGVRQGCLLSPFLFLLVIDWIMRTPTAQARNGIQWTRWLQLDDLDFANDLELLSHTHREMQEKTHSVKTPPPKLVFTSREEKPRSSRLTLQSLNHVGWMITCWKR